MADPAPAPPASGPQYTTIQLGQERVPLHEASAVFETPDANGRTPIVLIPTRPLRLRLDLLGGAGALLVIGILAITLATNFLLATIAFVGAVILAAFGGLSAFMVRVPEGTTALLVQGGRHRGTLGPGSHIVMPWVAVSHIITRRQIPFELPRAEALTSNNVRARIDLLLTFVIADPGRFVYAIAAPDFDLVLQAAGYDAVRSLFRGLTWAGVLEMDHEHSDLLRTRIEDRVRPFGVEIAHLSITYARPHDALLASEEARQIAVAQRAEAAELHALAERRLQDEQALAGVRLRAELEREQERLQAQVQQAEARRRVSEIESETQAAHLQRLEAMLAEFPRAAEWDWQSEQLEVVRALAANTRAVVQLGHLTDVARTVFATEVNDRNAPH
jgi:regulator of protease activity HflC (stomatin/prohibitin superfamily)